MAKKNKSKGDFVVYSTNPSFDFGEEDAVLTPDPGDQLLYVSIDRKQRNGKAVTLIEGFVGAEDDLKDLAKVLKSACGVGGSAKEGEILIQGEFKDKIADLLLKKGFKVKKKGG